MKTQKTFFSITIIIVLIIGFLGGYIFSHNNKISSTEQPVVDDSMYSDEKTEVTNTDDSVQEPIQNVKEIPVQTASDAYKTYSNKTIGFSTLVESNGKIVDKRTDITNLPLNIDKSIFQFVYMYAPKQNTNLDATAIFVWQDESGAGCKLDTMYSLTIDSKRNKAGLLVEVQHGSDAAMGSYVVSDSYSISNGHKKYCVNGYIYGHRPYDLEGDAYDNKEKINNAVIEDFNNIVKVFVDDFNILNN